MTHRTLTPLERQFLSLAYDYRLGLDDLARVYDMPPQKARQVLRRAQAKDPRACERLLRVVVGGGR